MTIGRALQHGLDPAYTASFVSAGKITGQVPCDARQQAAMPGALEASRLIDPDLRALIFFMPVTSGSCPGSWSPGTQTRRSRAVIRR